MLAKYKDVQTFSPENGRKEAFLKCFISGAYLENFSRRSITFRHFFEHSFFPAELSLSNLSNKNDSRGVRGMLL